jgi:hypothetical protein
MSVFSLHQNYFHSFYQLPNRRLTGEVVKTDQNFPSSAQSGKYQLKELTCAQSELALAD